MAKYNTKQRTALLNFLEQHADEVFSAREIAEVLSVVHISVSAVYRNLSELEAEGKIHKRSKSGSREAYYQYINAKSCKGCLHLSCKQCGKTFHMDTDIAERLTAQLDLVNGFSLDKGNTVLYGVCEDCKKD